MAQLRWGARQTLDYIYADLAAINDYAPDNPAAVSRLVHKIYARIKDEVEPLLQRANPPIEERVQALEEAIEQLKADMKKIPTER